MLDNVPTRYIMNSSETLRVRIMKMIKQMADTSLSDLITFLKLFPDAELICDADTGVMTFERCEVDVEYKAVF